MKMKHADYYESKLAKHEAGLPLLAWLAVMLVIIGVVQALVL